MPLRNTCLAGLLICGWACGQTSDWGILQTLKPGQPISVVTQRRHYCRLLSVTPAELQCAEERAGDARVVHFSRTEIVEVRLENEPGRSVTGMLIGAAAGGALLGIPAALSSDPEARGYSPEVFLIGAALGAAFGSHVHVGRHGQVLYKSNNALPGI